jgi:septal ring factor EnvC (AmiA/AmiB activator)
LAASDTLDIFADGIEMIALNEVTTSLPSISDRIGTLPLPVAGRVVRYYGEADAAGIKRSGIIVATSPQAIVTSPTAATIRYVGPLLDYGLVSMIEPQNGTLFVFAGLGQVFGTIGQVIPAGSPIGVMGGNSQTIDSILEQSEKGTGVVRSETLYIEVRQDKEPQDPLIWFRTIEE